MTLFGKKEAALLFIGDIIVLVFAIWLTLLLRYSQIPTSDLFLSHLYPFAFLIMTWEIVFFIVGLYEKHTLFLKSKLPTIILNAQIANAGLAVLFFYFVDLGITPKRNLFIYLLISVLLVLFWRLYFYPRFGPKKKQNAIIIGSGEEMKELRDEVNHNTRYGLKFVSSIDLANVESLDFNADILQRIYNEDISVIAVDLQSLKVEPFLPHLYNLIFSKVRFIEMHKIYEDIFDRIPLSLVKDSWFLENISLSPRSIYDFFKRLMDVVLSLVLGVLSLAFYPFVFLAIKFDDAGAIFSIQERVGKNNQPIKLYKFRTMTKSNDGGKWGKENDNIITRVGSFLRKTRIDELPQLWNVLLGDISIIGPRPEFAEPVALYEKQVPYYNIRHLIKPGLSGWAQIYGEHPHHGTDVSKTKNKLSYDLYYIKNRSFILDLKIALRTVKTFVSRTGI